MKKWLALLLAVLLLLSASALSEGETVEAVEFVSERAAYSMMIPADFIPASDSYINLVRTRVRNGNVTGISEEDLDVIQEQFSISDFSKMDMILDRTLNGNINIQTVDTGVPGSLYPEVKSLLDETNIESYTTLGLTEDDVSTYEMESCGNYNWYHISVNYLGRAIEQYMVADENGLAYLITFTDIGKEDIELVLSTFCFEEPTAEEE